MIGLETAAAIASEAAKVALLRAGQEVIASYGPTAMEALEARVPEIERIKTIAQQLNLIRGNSLESLSAEVANLLRRYKEAGSHLPKEVNGTHEAKAQRIGETRSQIEINRELGAAREHMVREELRSQYPESGGYKIHEQQYLRNSTGEIVKDPGTGEARRVDFMISKDNEVVDSIEVTSETAPKVEQFLKEKSIRENGGSYIRNAETGEVIRIPDAVSTEIRRRP